MCENPTMDHCQECGQIDCVEHMMNAQNLLTKKLKSLLSQVSADSILALIEEIYQLKIESNELERIIDMLQRQLQVLIDEDEQDFYNQPNTTTCRIELGQYQSLENDIEHLRKDIEELEVILEEINRRKSETDDTTIITHSPLKQINSSNLDRNKNELQTENETHLNEEIIGISDSNVTSRISQKIHLSNNIIRWLRGPAKIMFDGTMHVFDLFAQGTHISDAAIQAVKRGYDKQKQISPKQTFVEVTSDWTFEGENSNRGFNSPSIWMRDPQGRRILFKIQGHPLCAANEWLAYTLGKQLGLPVNEVQISIYQNNLVSLHTDVAHEHEKTLTFMELPRQTRRILLTDTIMGCMDLFDHMIQNADRNQRNILITMSNTTTIDDAEKMKIHLIDHASCFGMGKFSIISLIACKFHTNHLSIYKFDPINEARKFKHYLCRIPVADRKLIGNTLNRLAAITNNQFDNWMNEIQDLLSPSQYNRIQDVLYRQRDIAKSYTVQWDIKPNPVTHF
jgi:hypothetical protein